MLKSIRIQSFESHEDTIVRFGDNFNLIWGKSDSGKSSILRALAVVVNNQFSSKMVREGFAYCEIEVETDKGKVNCKRGEGVNKWLITTLDGVEHSFDKIGRTVPDLASEVLGMKEKQWGKQLSELPNFMFQDEKHYMLSEIGGEKSTSNMTARLMDKTIGLGGIEELVKEISSNILKNRKQITELQNKQSVIKSGMLSEEIIKSYEDKLASINKTRNEIYELEDKKKILTHVFVEECEINKNKEKLDSVKNKLDEVVNEYNDCKEQIYLFEQVKEFVELKNSLKIKNAKLCHVNQKLEIQDELSEINKEIKKYWDFCEFVKKFLELKSKLNKMKNDLVNNEKETKEFEDKIHKMKDELGICPICGKKFD